MLAQLDDLPHRAELDKAVASLQLAEAEFAAGRVHRDQAESDFHRAEKLRGTNSEATTRPPWRTRHCPGGLAMGEATVEQAADAKKQAEINLELHHHPLPRRWRGDRPPRQRRPDRGRRAERPSLFLMAKDLSHMLVWSAVNEADIGDIHVGQKVTFKVDAYRDRTFSGKVSQIRLNASMLQNVVTYGVVVDVDNTDGKLLPYMTAQAPIRGRPPFQRAAGSQPGTAVAADLRADFAFGPGRSEPPAAQDAAAEEKRRKRSGRGRRRGTWHRPRSGSSPTTVWFARCPSRSASPTA